jgi:hypothetical protein
MKIAINTVNGYFGISVQALKELVLRNATCIGSSTLEDTYNSKKDPSWQKLWEFHLFHDYDDIGDTFLGHRDSYNIVKDGLIYYLKDDIRTDKNLIEVIELLGVKSFGKHAKLKIIEIPGNVKWKIFDNDGIEVIYEIGRNWN